MAAAFVSLGCGLFALAGVFHERDVRRRTGRVPAAAGAMAGVGALLSGAFPTEVSDVSERVHSWASSLLTVAVVAIALSVSRPTRAARPEMGPDPVGAAPALVAVPLVSLSVLLHDTAWRGVGQRLLWLTLLAWLLRTAFRVCPLLGPREARSGRTRVGEGSS